MAKATPKLNLNQSENIPFDKLVLSQKNVRRIKDGVTIEQLAEDIGCRGLLQSLNVRPVRDDGGEETGGFEVPAGGRRFLALGLLLKQKRMAKSEPIPCIVNRSQATSAEEDSLAENLRREQLHPLDQFRAFHALHEQGLDEEEIAARFHLTAATVRQRLRLASVSPKILALYEKDEIKLEQVMAFSLTSDHARQEEVWATVSRSSVREPYYIRRLITETAVRADDRRAIYVGVQAFEAAGGIILRDLFQQDQGGWFQGPALLEKLVLDKLQADAETVKGEGWKWVEAAIDLGYGHATGLRRIYGQPAEMSAEDLVRHDAVKAEYEKLDAAYAASEEHDEETEKKIEALGEELDAFDDRPDLYDPGEVARAGAFVSLSADGDLRVERGFIRAQDEVRPEGVDGGDEGGDPADDDGEVVAGPAKTGVTVNGQAVEDEDERIRPLPDRLVIDLTAQRTLALRNALAQNPDVAFVAVLHSLVLQSFYRYASETCLELSLKSASFSQVQGLGETAWAKEIDERHENWGRDLPKSPDHLWDFLLGLDDASRHALFAHCAAQAVNAVVEPWNRRPRALAHADQLAHSIGMDMVEAGWIPTVDNYLGRVTKSRILQAVREGKDGGSAQLIDHLKKADMAREAARLLDGTGWLARAASARRRHGRGARRAAALSRRGGRGRARRAPAGRRIGSPRNPRQLGPGDRAGPSSFLDKETRMSAIMIYDHVPLGSLLRLSDGTPKPRPIHPEGGLLGDRQPCRPPGVQGAGGGRRLVQRTRLHHAGGRPARSERRPCRHGTLLPRHRQRAKLRGDRASGGGHGPHRQAVPSDDRAAPSRRGPCSRGTLARRASRSRRQLRGSHRRRGRRRCRRRPDGRVTDPFHPLSRPASPCDRRALSFQGGSFMFQWTKSCSYDDGQKRRFHSTARSRLKHLAAELRLAPGTFEIRSNKGGIAVSGEITLHHDGAYVQVGQFGLSSGHGILIRSCEGRRDFTGGPNRFAPLVLLDDIPALAAMVHAVTGVGAPSRASSRSA